MLDQDYTAQRGKGQKGAIASTAGLSVSVAVRSTAVLRRGWRCGLQVAEEMGEGILVGAVLLPLKVAAVALAADIIRPMLGAVQDSAVQAKGKEDSVARALVFFVKSGLDLTARRTQALLMECSESTTMSLS